MPLAVTGKQTGRQAGSASSGMADARQLHQDAQALRDWVTGGDATRYDNLPRGVVLVGVTHSNLKTSMPDIRLDLHITVSGRCVQR